MEKLRIGMLPLYLELYDRSWQYLRPRIDRFRNMIIEEFEKRGAEVHAAPVCRLKEEFQEAVDSFEAEKVDAIVTLHLAYSPSLESAKALASTSIPIIVLDTTPTYEFGPEQNEDEILYNHGIHGVQDLCNLLLRNEKKFFLEAGHWEESDVIDRVIGCIRSIKLAQAMRNARVGRVGESFGGMGDFDVPVDHLRSSIGIETIAFDQSKYGLGTQHLSTLEIESEMSVDTSMFEAQEIKQNIHRETTAASLIIRKWVEQERLTAFTANFLAVDSKSGLPCMPFLEASKAMARGTGYAGEGDVLTAALIGALLTVYPETSFTEMFCPDWEGNSIFLSHMGEMNLRLTAEKPKLAEKDFPFTDASNSIVAYACFKPGRAVLVDLAPGRNGSYTLITAQVEMLSVQGRDGMKNSIHGWFRPEVRIEEFLKKYSLAGGTHHLALVYGNYLEEIARFGELMGWNNVRI